MKQIGQVLLALTILTFGCQPTKNQENANTNDTSSSKMIETPDITQDKVETDNLTENLVEKSTSTETLNDQDQIQKLIRKVLEWSDSKESIDLLPAIADKDSVYVGFDLEMHNQNLEKLRMTQFFATEFIENYNQIIQTLDQKVRGKEFDEWRMGYLPTFSFANDSSPWCNCQDNLDWKKVEVKVNSLTSTQGDLIWYWGNLGSDVHPSWKEFEYRFRVVRDNDKWKIAYLQGFDLNKSGK